MAFLQRYPFLFVALMILAGCTKQPQKPTSPVVVPPVAKPVYKTTVLQGDNQTDTVGHPLKDDVQIKVYKDGKPFVNAIVLFKGSGCISKDSTNTITLSDGIASMQWYLSADVGTQTMSVIICDSARNHLDSLTLHATALKNSGIGNLACACGFGGGRDPRFQTFYKLHSGRIIANSTTTPKYSDDNGLSWYPLDHLTNFFLRKMVITPNDKIFALTSAGVISSTDQGINWTLVVRDDPNHIQIYDIAYTRGGILSYSSNFAMYLSSDDGKTWKKTQPTLSGSTLGWVNLTQQINGDLYVLSEEGELCKSTDGGTSWTILNSNPINLYEFYSSILIDDNGYIYLGRNDTSGGIYVSKDNGQTITKITFTPDIFGALYSPDWITKQSDGYYFIHTPLQGTFRTKDFVNIENISTRFNTPSYDFIVADNNNMILSAGKYDEYSYIPNQ